MFFIYIINGNCMLKENKIVHVNKQYESSNCQSNLKVKITELNEKVDDMGNLIKEITNDLYE